MNNKGVSGRQVLFGFVDPVIISIILYGVSFSFGADALCQSCERVVSKIALGDAIFKLGVYPCFLAITFVASVFLFPVLTFYWWYIMPKPLSEMVTVSFSKASFQFVFLTALYSCIWFIGIENLSEKWRGFYTLIFELPPLFYLMILCPIYFSSLFFAFLIILFQARFIKRKIK